MWSMKVAVSTVADVGDTNKNGSNSTYKYL